ncbi:hypothetical protein HanRHA438_Chr05g0224741 [Helianthus annuus]|nr:hypothetical protein HanRHA438_Chr05g0224741 [Helianthus annuus]
MNVSFRRYPLLGSYRSLRGIKDVKPQSLSSALNRCWESVEDKTVIIITFLFSRLQQLETSYVI